MVNEARSFGLAILLVVVGLAVLLYGVTLNHGASLNPTIAAGGVVVGIAVMTLGVVRIDTEHAE
jgi:peptidoglycan/LPS O-acetylase OafA/YrhL